MGGCEYCPRTGGIENRLTFHCRFYHEEPVFELRE